MVPWCGRVTSWSGRDLEYSSSTPGRDQLGRTGNGAGLARLGQQGGPFPWASTGAGDQLVCRGRGRRRRGGRRASWSVPGDSHDRRTSCAIQDLSLSKGSFRDQLGRPGGGPIVDQLGNIHGTVPTSTSCVNSHLARHTQAAGVLSRTSCCQQGGRPGRCCCRPVGLFPDQLARRDQLGSHDLVRNMRWVAAAGAQSRTLSPPAFHLYDQLTSLTS